MSQRDRSKLSPWRSAAVLVGACGSGVAAASDTCVQLNATMYECTGNQSGPILVPGTLPSDTSTLIITDLTTDVPKVEVTAPTFGVSVVFSDPTHRVGAPAGVSVPGIKVQALDQTDDNAQFVFLEITLNGTILPYDSGSNPGFYPAIWIEGTGKNGPSGSGDGGKGGAGHFTSNVLLMLGAAVAGDPLIGGVINNGNSNTDPPTPVIDLETIGGSGGPGANASNTGGGGGGPGAAGGGIVVTIDSDWTLNWSGPLGADSSGEMN